MNLKILTFVMVMALSYSPFSSAQEYTTNNNSGGFDFSQNWSTIDINSYVTPWTDIFTEDHIETSGMESSDQNQATTGFGVDFSIQAYCELNYGGLLDRDVDAGSSADSQFSLTGSTTVTGITNATNVSVKMENLDVAGSYSLFNTRDGQHHTLTYKSLDAQGNVNDDAPRAASTQAAPTAVSLKQGEINKIIATFSVESTSDEVMAAGSYKSNLAFTCQQLN